MTATTASPAHAATNPDREYLTFSLGDEEYAIDILNVQEIRPYELSTRIAGLPSHMKGVFNLRGTVVPIMDLRVRFGNANPKYNGSTVMVILNIGRQVAGIVVDGVSDVVHLGDDQMRPVPEITELDARFLSGLCLHEDRTLFMLDMEHFFTNAELSAPREAAGQRMTRVGVAQAGDVSVM